MLYFTFMTESGKAEVRWESDRVVMQAELQSLPQKLPTYTLPTQTLSNGYYYPMVIIPTYKLRYKIQVKQQYALLLRLSYSADKMFQTSRGSTVHNKKTSFNDFGFGLNFLRRCQTGQKCIESVCPTAYYNEKNMFLFLKSY